MARDMKRAHAGTSHKKGGSLLTGLLVGLIIGVAAAVGVALYVNRSDNPFTGKTDKPQAAASSPVQQQIDRALEILRPEKSQDEVAPPVVGETSAPAQQASGPERFDFYTMLPGLNDKEAKRADKPQPAASRPEPPRLAWVQAGAFQNEQDADNLKAKLALMGIEARIQTQDIPGKGLWHRVRIGPFRQPADMERVRAQLKGNGIDSAVTKGE